MQLMYEVMAACPEVKVLLRCLVKTTKAGSFMLITENAFG